MRTLNVIVLALFCLGCTLSPPEADINNHANKARVQQYQQSQRHKLNDKRRSGLMVGSKGIGIEIAPGIGIAHDGTLMIGIGL